MDTFEFSGAPKKRDPKKQATKPGGRKFLSVHWKCCNTFSRIYTNREGTAYEGRCPRCGSPIRAPIGPGGTNQRTFIAE